MPPFRNAHLPGLVARDGFNAITATSRMKYSSAVNSFYAFCAREGCLPIPDVSTLCAYISSTCRFVGPSGKPVSPRTVKSYLYGIASKFRAAYPEIDSTINSRRVRDVMNGCLRAFSQPVRRKDPLSVFDLVTAYTGLAPNYDNLLFFTLLSTGFFALHCLGELTVPDTIAKRLVRKIILRSTLRFSTCRKFAQYVLPYHKGDPFFLGSPVLLSSTADQRICPVRSMRTYVGLRDRLFPTSRFLFVTSSGAHPTHAWFLRRFSTFFPNSKLGHSMRSGGATALSQAGVPLEVIQDIGRWASEAFRVYVRGHPLLRLRVLQDCPITAIGHLGAQVQFD